MKSLQILFFGLFVSLVSFGQEKENEDSINPLTFDENYDWFNKDPFDSVALVYGIGTDKAYKLLNGRDSKEVIVAVLDSGIDIDHEDLQGKIWINEDEIPDNQIDDDGNGYIDDVNGWNFLGNFGSLDEDWSHIFDKKIKKKKEKKKKKKTVEEDIEQVEEEIDVFADLVEDSEEPKMIHDETLEMTRIVREGKKFDTLNPVEISKLKKKELKAYKYYKKALDTYNKELTETNQTYNYIVKLKEKFTSLQSQVEEDIEVTDYKISDLDEYIDSYGSNKDAAKELKQMMQRGIDKKGIEDYQSYLEDKIKVYYNLEHEHRDSINPYYSEYIIHKKKFKYGNNLVKGVEDEGSHGSHVAGIIAAVRQNNLGMNGVAENVKIMTVRTVPNGDEYDKDVANAIRYAVDNGAKIINMSFGKGFSPNKKLVDDAVKYASKKGVLLVHAAGNDNTNNDIVDNFPNDRFLKGKNDKITWIEVGASGKGIDFDQAGKPMIKTSFSNFGKRNVDIFAPGLRILSLDQNSKYTTNDGTSMASPVVAGAAALLWSYFPELKAKDIKRILLETAVEPYEYAKNQNEKDTIAKSTFFGESQTGAILNIQRAVEMALKLEEENKK